MLKLTKISVLPTGDRVLIMPDDIKTTSEGGVLLPVQAQQKQSVGVVIGCGPEVKNVKHDDYVIFQKYAGLEIQIDDVVCVLLRDKDILAIMA
ncbi:MAG: co-chaperone GroES [Chloroflexi bacterium]|nr:MAG: co-chaperone GroES [Chloroflexota bacterium]